jgi:hypothetical protein
LDRVQIAQVLGIDADVGKGIIVGGGHPPSVPPDASPRVPDFPRVIAKGSASPIVRLVS